MAAKTPTLEQHLRARNAPTREQRWLRYVREAQESRADLAISVAIDNIAIVDSRHHEHQSHEIEVREGRVWRCSCGDFRYHGGVCAHAAAAALHLWETQMDVDLADVPARALVGTVLRQYVASPEERRAAARPAGWVPLGQRGLDGYAEEPYGGPERPDL